MSGTTPTYDWAVKHAHIRNEYVRETIAEFLGTLVLLFFVTGAGLQGHFHPDHAASAHLVAVFGTVFGLMTAIFIFGGVSGAHINPAVSLGLAVAGHLKWAKLPLYWLAQILGGYLGCLLAFGLNKDHLQYKVVGDNSMSIADFDMKKNGGAIIGSMAPSGLGTSLAIGILTEIILTALLLMAVMSVIDKGNMQVPPFMIGFILCLVVAALGFTHYTVTGPMLNPARDFTPRLAAHTLGWSNDACYRNWSYASPNELQEWWVVGIFGPPIGAVLGVLMYNFLVGAQLTNNREGLDSEKDKNGDWRNTVFVPRPTNVPIPVAATYNPGPVNGHLNPAYTKEDLRQYRQY